MEQFTKETITSGINAIAAIAEAVRTAGEIPSGQLYALVCGTLTLGMYNDILGILKRAKLVEERGHLLRWVGPEIVEAKP